ncbi:hypothetical protein FA041_20140 [Escherichia coli]|nr:hypothetical protein [Escherichia coli]MBW9313105.1 hypothetical protein [Escherichia coli]NYZ31086.1 hypothetical protein [Escherichia coli]
MYDRKTSDWRGLSRWRGNSHSGICNLDSHAVYPAGAGTHPAHSCVPYLNRFIPLARELSTIYPPLLNGTGLSRWRGNFATGFMQAAQNRFIPLARELNSYTDKSSKQTVYPAGAETPLRLMNDNKNGGLSRWRGELAVPLHQRVQNPVYPAGAGNSVLSLPYIARISVYPAGAGTLISRR